MGEDYDKLLSNKHKVDETVMATVDIEYIKSLLDYEICHKKRYYIVLRIYWRFATLRRTKELEDIARVCRCHTMEYKAKKIKVRPS